MMGKSGEKKSIILWIVGGIIVYYLLGQIYFVYLASISFFSVLIGWLFRLPIYVGFIEQLAAFLSAFLLLIARPLMYFVIGGVLGLIVRLVYKKIKK